MRMLDRKLLRDLWQARGQALTIALVVACGNGAFIGSLSTYHSLLELRESFYETGRFAHVFARVKRAPAPVAERLRALPGVAEVETTVVADALLDLAGVVEPVTGRFVGLADGGNPAINRVFLRQGRWIAGAESDEVLVSEAFAQARGLKPGDTLHALLNGKRERLTVAGIALSPEYVFAAAAGGLADDRSFGVLWMGGKKLAAAYNLEGAFNQVAVRIAHGATVAAVIAESDRVLDPYGSTGAYSRDDQGSHRALTQEINEQRVFGIVMPSVFLAVAVFLLNVVLARQIGTQRTQIAALKALGVEDGRIAVHFMAFAAVIVAIGIVLGIAVGEALGEWMTRMYANFFRFPEVTHRVPHWAQLTAGGISLTAAAAGVLRVVLRVAHLPPAEAMRPPAPAVFRPTILERLGLGHLLSPQSRMIVRELERRPGRSALATLGIACSLAILISGTWWRDAIEYFIDVEFGLRERQAVTLVLAEPVSSSAVYELAQLPGVLQVEAARAVPVRLNHGHLAYRTAITGLPAEPQVRQVLDERLRRVELPPDGIVLTDRLARRLALRPGDEVWVDVLEGKRLKRPVRVAGEIGELVGMNAYMQLPALAALLGEGETISVAHIVLDAAQREAFFRRVKETPRVAQVMEKAPIVQTFRETSARNILVFTMVLTVLAATIAIGVVYNSARIALSERAWELASLRVLGFTRAEVSQLLLGQLAVELLVALPLGWLLGYALSAAILGLIPHEVFEIPLVIRPRTYAYATVTMLAAGVVSAAIVRARIDRLDLVAVLKMRE